MKSRILLSILVFLVICVKGQYNTQLIDSSKHWSTIDEYTAGGGIPYSFYTKFSEDTIIENVSYKKVFTSYDEFMNDWELTGFIRETDNKIYLRNLSNEEGLIYDFGAQVGDTIHINNNLGFWTGWQLDVVVSSIDSVFIEPEGVYRKSILVREAALPNPLYETWIEGIGSEAGVLFSGFRIMGATGTIYSLLCNFEDDILIYKNPFHNICFYPIMNIEAQGTRINDFIISPNPVRDISYLIIKPSEQQILTIKIFNSTGTFIEEHQVKSPAKIKIHSSDYPTGIYFYQVIKEGKSIYNSKFIVL